MLSLHLRHILIAKNRIERHFTRTRWRGSEWSSVCLTRCLAVINLSQNGSERIPSADRTAREHCRQPKSTLPADTETFSLLIGRRISRRDTNKEVKRPICGFSPRFFHCLKDYRAKSVDNEKCSSMTMSGSSHSRAAQRKNRAGFSDKLRKVT